MTPILIEQLSIAAFGLTALFMSHGSPAAQKWSPILGLAGQPFWAWFALRTEAFGLYVLVPLYTAGYVYGVWRRWR